MKELYRVSGLLNSGFVGQITYTVCLPEIYTQLDIGMRFEKQHYPSMEVVPAQELEDYCLKEYGMSFAPGEDKEAVFLHEMKTEIHLMATMNDTFIGCIHRQELERHMLFCDGEATEGCLYPREITGVLKVTVLAFNVLMDETPYEVWVCAK